MRLVGAGKRRGLTRGVGVVVGVGAVAAGALLGPAAAVAAENAPLAPYCDPFTTRTYSQTSFAWHSFDSGTIDNPSSGTITRTITHSSSASLTTTVSAEVGVAAKTVVTEISLKLGYSVAVTASYTTTTTFSITAPPRTKISYKDGIAKRTFNVRTTTGFTNCNTRVTNGTAYVADSYSEARNV